jgi:bisphosphoglycerate-dependent phosphoglycerate mutase family 1
VSTFHPFRSLYIALKGWFILALFCFIYELKPCGYFTFSENSLLLEGGYEIDVVFTSRLKRAIRSSWILLQELNEVYLPVFKSWRLNERMYGALTGLSKKETAEQLGHELVQAW